MPVLTQNQPYDTAETVLNFVRIIMADYIQNAGDIAGDFFADTQPYTLPTLNLAWRLLQEKMALAGNARLQPTIIITGLPPVNSAVSADPATFVYLSWLGFFNGVNLLDTPLLPPDLIFPIRLRERQSGTTQQFGDMHPATDGLPSVPPGSWLRIWEWMGIPGGAGEAIYMKGSTLPIDLEVRYAAYLPDIVADQVGGLAATPIPVMRCAQALAYFTASIYVSPREGGAAKSTEYEEKGDKCLTKLLALPTKEILSRVTFRRRPGIGGGRNRYSR